MVGIKFASYMGRPRVSNLPSNIMGTSKMREAEKNEIDKKNTSYTNEKNELLQDKQVYTSLKSEFRFLTQTLNDLATFEGNEKKVIISQEGYIKVKANRNVIDGTFNMTVTQLAEHHQIVSNPINVNERLNVNDTLKIGGKELKITSDMTYKDLINRINDGEHGVSAYTHGGKIFMHAKKVGEANKIELIDGTSDLLKKMFYTQVKTGQIDGVGNVKQKLVLNTINTAKDATHILNGIEGSSSNNTITPIPGMEIELLKVMGENIKEIDSKNRELKFTISNSNVSDATKLIKQMVSDYNKATSAFEHFAGIGGPLQGQAIMKDLYREMHNVTTFSQNGNYLSTYGIQFTDDGIMKVDDEKLKKALQEQPGAAKQFFFSAEGLGKMMGKPFEEIFGDYSIVSERIKNIDLRVNDLNKKISYVDFYNKQKQDENVDKYKRLEIANTLLHKQMQTMRSWIR